MAGNIGSSAIYVVLIIVVIITVITGIVLIIRGLGILDPPPPNPDDMIFVPEIWGLQQKVGECTGYRIPPINATTPTNSVNYSINTEGLTPRPQGFPSCLWQDE